MKLSLQWTPKRTNFVHMFCASAAPDSRELSGRDSLALPEPVGHHGDDTGPARRLEYASHHLSINRSA